MTAAQMLAVGGTTSALLSMCSGFANEPKLLGIAGAIMLFANVSAFIQDAYLKGKKK